MPEPCPDRCTAAVRRPKLSVVVPTFNRLDRLRRVLDALACQTAADDFEVIVVSDGSTDGTSQYLAGGDHPCPIVALDQPNRGAGAARNRGVEHAAGDLVLFIDDDVVPSPRLVEEHLAAQAGHERRVVIGPMLTPLDHPMSAWVEWEQDMLYKQYGAMRIGQYGATARQFYTGNASVPRALLEESGGFDESLRRAEDVELAFRLADMGAEFSFHPSAEGFHYADRTLDSWCNIASEYGRNDVIFARHEAREWLPEFITWAYRDHHIAVRACTRVGVNSDAANRVLQHSLRALARSAHGRWLSRPALSILYSIRYHRGVLEELGSREAFWSLMRTSRIPPTAGAH